MTEKELIELLLDSKSDGLDSLEQKLSYRSLIEEVLERNYNWITRMCLVEIRDSQVALDCSQEVLFRISQSISRFDGRSALSTWIYTILKRTIWEYNRKESKRRKRFPLGSEKDVLEEAQDTLHGKRENIPDVYLSISQERREILLKLNALAEKQRRAIYLHYFEDYSIEQIAECLDCSVSSVKTHLLRARKKLKKILEKEKLKSYD